MAQGFQDNPPRDPPARKTKGRPKQSDARNVLERLSHLDHVLAFLDDVRIPFDNSQAERDIRMVKVQQKILGYFRAEAGAHTFCRIRSYVSTLLPQGFQLLTALELTFAGHPVLPAF